MISDLAPVAVRAFQYRADIQRFAELLAPVKDAFDESRKEHAGDDPIFGTIRVTAEVTAVLAPRLAEIEALYERINTRVLQGHGAEPWTRARYQAHLKRLGLYRGEVDGLPGKLTEDAVAAFQRMKGMKIVDGEVGPATTELLIADGA